MTHDDERFDEHLSVNVNRTTRTPQGFTSQNKGARMDSRWFEKHPHRRARIRRPVAGEVAALGGSMTEVQGYPARILTVQIKPGVRKRELVYTRLPLDADDEVVLAYLNLVLRAYEQGYQGKLSNEDLAIEMGIQVPVKRH